MKEPHVHGWIQIESFSLSPLTLEELFWLDSDKCSHSLYSHSLSQIPSLLCMALEIWKKIKRTILPKFSRLSSFTNQSWFLPGQDSSFLQLWRGKQANRLECLWSKDCMKTEAELEDLLGQPIYWYSYFQLHHLCTSYPISQIWNKPLNSLEQIIHLGGDGVPHLFSLLSRTILDAYSGNRMHYQKKWDLDLKENLTESQWDSILNSPSSQSPIFAIRIQKLKIFTHWYLAPSRIHSFDKSRNPYCL